MQNLAYYAAMSMLYFILNKLLWLLITANTTMHYTTALNNNIAQSRMNYVTLEASLHYTRYSTLFYITLHFIALIHRRTFSKFCQTRK